MTSAEFTDHLRQFLSSHGFNLDKKERVKKFYDEVGEHLRAQLWETEKEEAAEAVDCCVTAWALCLSYGIEDPLAAMLEKLQEAAQRPHYREMRERVDGKVG